jgi:FtsP/CotA-like multicopper oxidase with cupredoxin domain
MPDEGVGLPLDQMHRRHFLATLAAAAIRPAARGADKPDFTLHIAPASFEIAPHKVIKTIAYNGSIPGPLLRVKEGQPVTIEVFNDTGDAEIVHWHGLQIPSAVDGAMEEGTPMIPAHASASYTFTPKPSGTRWYHTHVMAGRNLKRATYTGQFGFFYIDPRSEPGNYDQEVFLALKEWEPYFSSGGEGGDDSLDVAYSLFSVNDRALGHGEPIRVKEGQRVLLRILNASATITRRIAVAGHKFRVVAMDGNPVAMPNAVPALELGPAERIDAIVEMNQPGVWILGATDDHDREHGLGIVIEYSGQSGEPRWLPAVDEKWDYTVFGNVFGNPGKPDSPADVPERVQLSFEKKFAGHHWVDKWTINGKSFPKTDPIRVRSNGRYRLVFDNRSDEAHPVHLHRHTFELVKIAGVPTSGVYKDVVVVGPKSQTEVDLIANNPGLTLFHCHQQMHMDYGFMTLMEYT